MSDPNDDPENAAEVDVIDSIASLKTRVPMDKVVVHLRKWGKHQRLAEDS